MRRHPLLDPAGSEPLSTRGWWRGLTLLCVTALLVLSQAALADRTPVPTPASGTTMLVDPAKHEAELEALIHEGVRRNASGDLDGADLIWIDIKANYPDHPAPYIYSLDTLDWRKQIDFTDKLYDGRLKQEAKQGRKLAEAWVKRAPDNALAHYYLGQVLFALVKIEAMDGKFIKAGKVGEKGRKHNERALELDPGFVDAKFALGTYSYYVSVANRYIKFLSWLWFVPTGDRDLGLQYLAEVAAHGDIRRFEALATLQRILMYMEDDPPSSRPFVEEMIRLHPENSYVQFEVVEVRLATGDYARAVEAARSLEQTTGDRYGDSERRSLARIWRARAELFRGRTDEAGRILDEVDMRWDEIKVWGRRWALLTRGNLQDLKGDRESAIGYYKKVVKLKTRWGSTRPVRAAEAALEAPFGLEGLAPVASGDS
jgi:tetratricopeptide (TPR) repeat protein